MNFNNLNRNKFFFIILWLLEGMIVGFGAILPGISGGALCVAFGMYRPLIKTISDLKYGIKKYGLMLGVFLIGVIVGFIGLSGLASFLLNLNATLVTCTFIGFIIGTFPELWKDTGNKGRNKNSYKSLWTCFFIMLIILMLLETKISIIINTGIPAYLFCGILWGLSFIIPGLSSSSLLLFFGLYQPMLEGISLLNFKVIMPMVVGIILSVLLLSKLVENAYKKNYSIISHGVFGIVVATTVMLIPFDNITFGTMFLNLFYIVFGSIISFCFTKICNRLREKAENKYETD